MQLSKKHRIELIIVLAVHVILFGLFFGWIIKTESDLIEHYRTIIGVSSCWTSLNLSLQYCILKRRTKRRYCPECKKENLCGVKVCEHCNCIMVGYGVSSFGVVAFVLGVMSPFFSLLAAVPGLICGVIALRRIKRSNGHLKGKGLAKAGIALSILFSVLTVGLFILWTFDAEPIPNDYTLANLKYPGPEYDETWEMLNSLADVRVGVDGLLEEESGSEVREMLRNISAKLDDPNQAGIIRAVMSNADSIEQLWENSKVNRELIKQMGKFEYTNDLMEPCLEADLDFLTELKNQARIYTTYAVLEAVRGNDLAACQIIAEMSQVSNKLSATCRSMLTKLVCFSAIQMELDAMNIIINQPSTSDDAVELLKKQFEPLTEEQVSIKNCVLFQYLMEKNTWDGHIDEVGQYLPLPLKKRNSTFRVLKNQCDETIAFEKQKPFEPLCVWPRLYSWMPHESLNDEELGWKYRVYNPVGSTLIYILMPATQSVIRIVNKIAIKDDLFQIVLAMRLGEDYSLKDQVSGRKYILDIERKIIYSPGQDEKPFTWDDVKLPINPDVLNIK